MNQDNKNWQSKKASKEDHCEETDHIRTSRKNDMRQFHVLNE